MSKEQQQQISYQWYDDKNYSNCTRHRRIQFESHDRTKVLYEISTQQVTNSCAKTIQESI